jgi:hypothetical protein
MAVDEDTEMVALMLKLLEAGRGAARVAKLVARFNLLNRVLH